MRKLMRSIARHNMEASGIVRLNKKRGDQHKSAFAKYWRSYVLPGCHVDKGLAVRTVKAHA